MGAGPGGGASTTARAHSELEPPTALLVRACLVVVLGFFAGSWLNRHQVFLPLRYKSIRG